jgi:5,10-methylenetetrahydromethanopterin reductase
MPAQAAGPTITISDFPAKNNTLSVAEIAAVCRRAEDLGFDRFAVTDWPYYFDCIPTIAACLAATSRIEVESLVTTPFARHPEATACAFATMSEYSGGRVILGVGAGVEDPSSVWVEPWGHSRPRPLRAVRELVSICREMWAGGDSPTAGEMLRGSGLPLRFTVRSPIPVLIAARGPRMLQLAGELADIVHIAPPFLGERYVAGCIERIAAGAARAERSLGDFEIDLTISAAVLADREHARSLAKVITGYGIIWMTGVEKYAQQRPDWQVPDELEIPAELVRRLGETWDMWSGEPMPADCAAMIDDHVLDQFSVAGEAGECGEKLRKVAERHPQVTGLRLKLPPLSGHDSLSGYLSMLEGVAEAVATWR